MYEFSRVLGISSLKNVQVGNCLKPENKKLMKKKQKKNKKIAEIRLIYKKIAEIRPIYKNNSRN